MSECLAIQDVLFNKGAGKQEYEITRGDPRKQSYCEIGVLGPTQKLPILSVVTWFGFEDIFCGVLT